MIKKIESVYTSSDGSEFPDSDSAQCHEDCLTAFSAWQAAEAQLLASLAANHYRTADDEPFTLHGTKWLVAIPFYELMVVQRVNPGWDHDARYYFEDGILHLEWHDGKGSKTRAPVTAFFSSELAAKQKVLDLKKERLKRHQQQLMQEEAEIAAAIK